MEEPVVFALTPRGGRWNHRFLVPVQSDVPQPELLALADRARRGGADDILCVTREVQQVFNGRPGIELLVVMDSRLSSASVAVRAEINDRLHSFLEPLDRLVHDVDWDRDGRQLTVERSELKVWRDELRSLISSSEGSSIRQPTIPSTPAHKVPVAEPDAAAPRVASHQDAPRTRRWTIILLCSVAVAALLWRLLPFRDVAQGRPSNELLALANDIGVKTSEADRLQLLTAIELRLRTMAFTDLSGATGASDSVGHVPIATEPQQAEDRLVVLLQRLNATIHPQLDRVHGTLTGLLDDSLLRDALRRLFPGGQFDRSGLLTVYEGSDTQTLRRLAECCDHSVVGLLIEAALESASVGQSPAASSSTKLSRLIGKLLPYLPPENLRSQSEFRLRRFYVEQDVRTVHALEAWLADNRRDPALQRATSQFDSHLRLDEFLCRIALHLETLDLVSPIEQELSATPGSESALARFIRACGASDCSR